MLITTFNPNRTIYNKANKPQPRNNNAMSAATSYSQHNRSHSPQIASSPSFTGLIEIIAGAIIAAGKTTVPEALKGFNGDIYRVRVFDKIKKETVNLFLVDNIKKATNDGSIRLYDREGNKIGVTTLDFSKWNKKDPLAPREELHEPHTYIDYMENFENDQYKGIGKILMQASIEKSLQTEAKGKTFFYAYDPADQSDPFLFHNGMGFRLGDPKFAPKKISQYMKQAEEMLNLKKGEFLKLLNKHTNGNYKKLSQDEKLIAIYETIANHKKCNTSEVYLQFKDWMYLRDDKLKNFWIPKIQAEPIFINKNKLN